MTLQKYTIFLNQLENVSLKKIGKSLNTLKAGNTTCNISKKKKQKDKNRLLTNKKRFHP